jgi:hypothetical protein
MAAPKQDPVVTAFKKRALKLENRRQQLAIELGRIEDMQARLQEAWDHYTDTDNTPREAS